MKDKTTLEDKYPYKYCIGCGRRLNRWRQRWHLTDKRPLCKYCRRVWKNGGSMISIGLSFEPQDLWIGVYWRRDYHPSFKFALQIFICIIPCLPIMIYYGYRGWRES